jgi:hypothetical protein
MNKSSVEISPEDGTRDPALAAAEIAGEPLAEPVRGPVVGTGAIV